MNAIKEFLKPEGEEQSKRNLRKIYLFGFFFLFLIGFIGGLYLSGSILIGFIVAIIVSLPFLITAVPLYIVSIVGINKKWSKKAWSIVSLVMILIGLLILLLGSMFR